MLQTKDADYRNSTKECLKKYQENRNADSEKFRVNRLAKKTTFWKGVSQKPRPKI